MQALVWLGFVVLCNGLGFLSSLPGAERAVYGALVQPSWAPPSWVFAPVWTTLYTMMATATYLVWRRCKGRARRDAMIAFAVQLALNVAWSPVFFGLQQYGLAVIVIAFVVASVAVMGVLYYRCVKLAGLLIVPLLLWVSFATALNAAVWALNR
jgi:tryptophan-rich sensory protein